MHEFKDEKSEPEETEFLTSLVKRLGNPESTALLHSACHLFQISEVDGAIGYHRVGNHAIVIGDPICLPQDFTALIEAFHLHCQKHGLKTLYLLASQDFAYWAVDHGCHTLIQVGSELSVNPTRFQKKHKIFRKINRSIRSGVDIKEYKEFDASLEHQMTQTIHAWLKQKKGPQIHLGVIDFFKCNGIRRVFYAKQKDQIVGLLMLTSLDRFQGWVVNSYLTLPDAPKGTTEYLMYTTIDALAKENCHFLCLGIIAGTKLGEMIGLKPFGKLLARLIFKAARWFFKLDTKAIYLNKYHPSMRSTFLVCKEKLSWGQLLAIKQILHVKL